MVDIEKSLEDGLAVVKVRGEIDASSSILLDDEISKIVQDSPGNHILIDCRDLEYISSAGLGVFIAYLKTMDENQAKMVLFGLHERVRQVFEILGLDQILPIVENELAARKIVNEG